MAQSDWPFDNADTTETQYSQLFRRLQESGVWGDPGDISLKLVAGTGLNTTLRAGYAFVRGHMYYNDADLTVPIPAGSAAQRVDRLVLRLDPSANTITPVVIAGTSGSASPNAMQATDTGLFDVEIAQITVPASASSISGGNIADKRKFAGHIYGLWADNAGRPASPRRGQPGYNSTLGAPEYWDGATWKPFAATTIAWGSITGVPSTFAPSSHSLDSHSGTLSATKGGTGQTTLAAVTGVGHAIKTGDPAFRIWVQSAQPTGAASGDLWFW